ncbi:MAG TPA: SDR family NAD(P)-dependent oxidoreductase [Membranihabitans sp.]|nr:SDR family NAD(P)-dependent oxidoreductase [Membranihabitans sp.]
MNTPHTSWQGQTAVVTGAATGLGLSIAQKLNGLNVRLALIDIDRAGLESVREQFPDDTLLIQTDITDEKQVSDTLASVLERFERIDILVNSAGITGQTNLKSHEVEVGDLQRVFDVNFKGAWLMSKYAIPDMLRRSYGRILHIASIAGKEGNAGMLAYSASKAAVIGMTKVQGKEYAETGLTINAIAPAVIRTKMVEAMSEEQVRYMTDKIPMKRCGTLAELADMAVFIVSPNNSFSTGFTFDLSGGRATY